MISRLTVAAGAASMAFAPIAVQANTRANTGGVINASQSGTTSDPWIIRDDEGGFWLENGGILAIVFGGLAIGGLLVVLGDNDDQSPPRNQSPGAN